jgi:hypothetical protein
LYFQFSPKLCVILFFGFIVTPVVVPIIGTIIVFFAIFQAWISLYLVRQAYGVTNKGLIIFRTGAPQPVAQLPDRVVVDGLNHAIKIPFEGIFPITITMNVKSGKS